MSAPGFKNEAGGIFKVIDIQPAKINIFPIEEQESPHSDLLTVRTFLVLLKEHIHGSIGKSMAAFAGSGSLFRIEPSWLSCRLPVIFRLRRVLRLYEQRIIGKKGLPQQPLLAL